MSPRSQIKQAFDWQRLSVGVLAISLGLTALFAKFGMDATDTTGVFVYGTFGKVAFVLGMAWLAWPQLMWLKEMPGGGIGIAAIMVGCLIFIARPRLLLYFVPLLVAIVSLFMTITWVQRNILPPK